MWIKTQCGNLCNIGRATDIAVGHCPITKQIEVFACFDGPFVRQSGELEQNETLIASFGSQEEATQYMKGLSQLVGAKPCVLNNR